MWNWDSCREQKCSPGLLSLVQSPCYQQSHLRKALRQQVPHSQAPAYPWLSALTLQVVGKCFFFFTSQSPTVKKQLTVSFSTCVKLKCGRSSSEFTQPWLTSVIYYIKQLDWVNYIGLNFWNVNRALAVDGNCIMFQNSGRKLKFLRAECKF